MFNTSYFWNAFCFVLIPFHTKIDAAGCSPIDFGRIYQGALKAAIEDAGLERATS
jgi:hypothetical protein